LKQQRRDDDNARLREPYAFGYHNNYEHTVPGTSSMMLSLVVSSCAYALVVSYSAQVLPMPNSANVTVEVTRDAFGVAREWAIQLELPYWCTLLWIGLLLEPPLLETSKCNATWHGRLKGDIVLRLGVPPLSVFASPLSYAHAVVALSAHLLTLLAAAQPGGAAIVAVSHFLVPICNTLLQSRLVTWRGVTSVVLLMVGYYLITTAMRPDLLSAAALLETPDFVLAARGIPQLAAATVLALVTRLQTTLATCETSRLPGMCLPTRAIAATLLSATLALLLRSWPLASPHRHVDSIGGVLWTTGALLALRDAFGTLHPLSHGNFPATAHSELRVGTRGVVGLLCAAGALHPPRLAWLGQSAMGLHFYALYWVGRDALAHGLQTDEMVTKHGWISFALYNIDTLRLSFAMLPFMAGKLLVSFATAITPQPFRFYCYNGPVTDHGDEVQMGVAWFVPPRGDLNGKPSTYVCNVGDIPGMDGASDRAKLDYVTIGHSTVQMVQSLNTAEAARRGFHGQYLAQFPTGSREDRVKQLNLTAWTDDQMAHEWYVGNEVHERLVQQYRTGSLASFSSMLARLHPAQGKTAMWQVRCHECAALVSGYPEERFCKVCGTQTHGMPLF